MCDIPLRCHIGLRRLLLSINAKRSAMITNSADGIGRKVAGKLAAGVRGVPIMGRITPRAFALSAKHAGIESIPKYDATDTHPCPAPAHVAPAATRPSCWPTGTTPRCAVF